MLCSAEERVFASEEALIASRTQGWPDRELRELRGRYKPWTNLSLSFRHFPGPSPLRHSFGAHTLVLSIISNMSLLLSGIFYSGEQDVGGQSFDYIVVGGGLTGLTVANRLSEDSSRKYRNRICDAQSNTVRHRACNREWVHGRRCNHTST